MNFGKSEVIDMSDNKEKSNIAISQMSIEQFHDKLEKGYMAYKKGKTQNAAKAFNKFKESIKAL